MTDDGPIPTISHRLDDPSRATGSWRRHSLSALPGNRNVRLALIAVATLLIAAPIIVGSMRPKSSPKPEPLAALVNGLPVTMASYKRQLDYATAGYQGPGAPGSTPTGITVARLLADRAIQQAIGEALIDQAASKRNITVSDSELTHELDAMTKQAGGLTALQAQMRSANMTSSDLQSIARHYVLRSKIAAVLHDQAWLDHLIGSSTVQYYVSDGAAGADNVPAISLGHPAPPFVGRDMLGRAISLADLRGRAVILNFWATWCGYCASELPMLLHFARAHPSYYVVALNHGENRSTVQRYVEAHHLEGLTVWLDASGDAYANYDMTGLPATFFIDDVGYLRSYNFGALADSSTLADQAEHARKRLDNTYYNQGN
jgi:thiol-disulfide isomerase/thioredoxin